eukprot:Awhi_evm2s9411
MPFLPYPIGTKGVKWGDKEKKEWFEVQSVKRSYKDEVVSKIDVLRSSLKDSFEVNEYGSLSVDHDRYPLFVFKSKNWDEKRKTVLVTGGVHGYETSGVQGALRFMETKASNYISHFNVVCFPCISPWSYETINRWDFKAVDPNRSFYEGVAPVYSIDVYTHLL